MSDEEKFLSELDSLDEILGGVEDKGDAVCPEGTAKLDSDYSGYMELTGAKKDGDCRIVHVEGGVSKDKGCCNLFHPANDPEKFSCGTCKYLGESV